MFFLDIDDTRFGQEIFNIVNNMGKQLCAVLRYSIRGGQGGLEVIASRFVVCYILYMPHCIYLNLHIFLTLIIDDLRLSK